MTAFFLLILFFLCTGFPLFSGHASAVEQKALKPEEILRLRNFELSLQNMELQLELIRRDLDRLKQERERYLEELYKTHGVDKGWKIDLQNGVWFMEQSPMGERSGAKTGQ